MSKFLITGDGRRLRAGDGQPLVADASGSASLAIGLALASMAFAAPPVQAETFRTVSLEPATTSITAPAVGMVRNEAGAINLGPVFVTFASDPIGLKASTKMQVSPSGMSVVSPAVPMVAVFPIETVAANTKFSALSVPLVTERKVTVVTASMSFNGVPVPMVVQAYTLANLHDATVSFHSPAVSISRSMASVWKGYWLNLYNSRQALLNAIDAKNRLLATNAGNIATATAAALVTTNTNVTNLDGRITAEAARITALQSTIEHPTTGLAAAAAAVSSLTTRVGNVEGVNTAQASSITSLTTTVGNHTTSINSYATSINGLQGKAGLSINANGHVVGWALNNNGASGDMVITANKFRVVDPSNTYNHMEFVDGDLNVSGKIISSLVTGSALALGSTRITCGGGRLAPFTIRDSKYYISPGTNASRTLLLDGFVSPSYGSGYDFKRFARNKMDVWIDCQISGDTGNETAYIEVQYDGGAWSSIMSVTFNCNYRGSFPIMIRYTTLDSWSTAAFRLRTTQNRTEALRITVDVANYNESGNSAGSNSGATGGGSTPPVGNGGGGPGGDGGGVFCVDYETTLLPDGRHIYEMEVGEAAQCWNQDGESPAVILMPLRAMKVGYEKCYQLFSGNTLLITQSESTPMVLRDGRVVRTPEMRGEHVLLRNQLEWIEVTDVVDVGVRKVAMPDFADSMFFAGVDADRTIATHNVIYKPLP